MVQRSALCRSRQELSNEYLLVKIGVDTAENEPFEVWGKIIQYYSFVSFDGTSAPRQNRRTCFGLRIMFVSSPPLDMRPAFPMLPMSFWNRFCSSRSSATPYLLLGYEIFKCYDSKGDGLLPGY